MKIPSVKLAPITRKINEIRLLLQDDPVPCIDFLRAEYSELVARNETLRQTYEEEYASSTTDQQYTLQEWYQPKAESRAEAMAELSKKIRPYEEAAARHLAEARTRASNVSIRTRSSHGSRSSSTRIKLAEEKAAMVAEKALAEKIAEADRFALEADARKKAIALQREEIRISALERELDIIDGVAADTLSPVRRPPSVIDHATIKVPTESQDGSLLRPPYLEVERTPSVTKLPQAENVLPNRRRLLDFSGFRPRDSQRNKDASCLFSDTVVQRKSTN